MHASLPRAPAPPDIYDALEVSPLVAAVLDLTRRMQDQPGARAPTASRSSDAPTR